ncbi:DUF2062 domain-containing protein [Haloferax namakaokahaiae]|uniref:DUF2062 domain-containing protein n=1 Tax=Haloferax namakaokahaiae TaxID=1748331 RepID=A0ABD5ZKG3_9EURY
MYERLFAVRDRIRTGIIAAFEAQHTPHEIALSFAFGVFVTVLPTAGTALALFVLVSYYVERASKLALGATVVIFNPPVKWALYGASFWLGSFLLGPVGTAPVDPTQFTLDAGYDIIVRQLLGNAIFAVGLAVLGYVLAYAVAQVYYQRETTTTAFDFS